MLAPEIKIIGGVLTITLDLKRAVAERRPSASGKTLLLTSVNGRDGNVDDEKYGQFRIGLNVMQNNPAYSKELADAVAKLEAERTAAQAAEMQAKAMAEFERRRIAEGSVTVKKTA